MWLQRAEQVVRVAGWVAPGSSLTVQGSPLELDDLRQARTVTIQHEFQDSLLFCTPMFTVTSFITAKGCYKCPVTDKLLNKIWHILKNRMVMPAPIQTNPEHTMLGEGDGTCAVRVMHKHFYSSQSHRTAGEAWGRQRWGCRVIVNTDGFQFGMMERV